MALEVTMPQMGESVVEGTVTRWLVHEGDQVKEDQPLCEISTDKVDTEIPSPGDGVISQLVAAEGETLPVGATLAMIDAAGAQSQPKAQAAPTQAAKRPAPTAARQPQAPVLRAVRTEPARPQPVAAKPAPSKPAAGEQGTEPSTRPAPPSEPPPEAPSGEHRRYSPVVMRMAEEHDIDLQRVPGSGIGGRVSKRDVLAYLDALRAGKVEPPAREAPRAPAAPAPGAPTAAATAPAPPPAARPAAATAPSGSAYRPPVYEPRAGDAVEPFTRRRKLIAEHMVYSKTHSPHVGTLAEVDLTRAMALRQQHKASFAEREGFTLTMLPLAAAATVRALKEFPRMNASVVGDSVIIRHQINLGIAMDSEEGLLVPVIKEAEGMSVVGLAREIERLRGKIADRKIIPDDLAGGSFTLSNPGREGNLFGFAIINQPQVGILRMGEVKKRPVVVETDDGADALAIRTMMYLALSYDHRVIDGVLGNSFLYRVARILEAAEFDL